MTEEQFNEAVRISNRIAELEKVKKNFGIGRQQTYIHT